MNYFPFQPKKATETAMFFIDKEGGKMEILKLAKLLYLAERKSIELRDVPIFGGKYCSLPFGPITSETLDCCNGKGKKANLAIWNKAIAPRAENSNWIELARAKHDPQYISPREQNILEELWKEHGSKGAIELKDWCHENIDEYEETTGQEAITLKEVGLASKANLVTLKEESQARNVLSNVFAF
jgi:uncharacterized phage-associated protein